MLAPNYLTNAITSALNITKHLIKGKVVNSWSF